MPASLIDSLVEARRSITREMREIVSGAEFARRSLTAADEARLAELDDRFEALGREERRLRELDRKLAPTDALRARIAGAITGGGDADAPRPDPIRDMIANHEQFRDFAPVGSDATRRLPDLDWGARPGRLDNAVGVAQRAIADFSDSSSLFVSDFMARVALYQRTLSPWLRLATTVVADDGRPLVVPQMTADVTSYTPGEGTAITESSGTLGSGTAALTSYKALTYISTEAWEDSETNLSDLVARSHARSIGLAFGSAATTAILAAATNGGTATGLGGGSTATFLGYEDLLDLKYGRPAPYRENGSFVMANGAIRKARKWADGNGQYLWSNAASVAGQPDALDGDGVFEDPYLAAPGSATKSVVYGDVGAALVVKVRALRVAISADFRFDTDQIAVRSTQRIGLVVADPQAIAYMVSKNS